MRPLADRSRVGFDQDVLELWAKSFPNFEPVAHRLHAEFADRWARFHSLPESKRYPDSEEELVVVLHRHNAVLAALAGRGDPVVLLTTEFSWVAAPALAPTYSPSSVWWRTARHGEAFWHVYGSESAWEPHLFDPIVRRVAEDGLNIGNVMICDAGCRWIVHPYDGGMDVVVRSTGERDRLRSKFAGWLSPHPEGL